MFEFFKSFFIKEEKAKITIETDMLLNNMSEPIYLLSVYSDNKLIGEERFNTIQDRTDYLNEFFKNINSSN